jgi:hypothetical protein
MHQISLHEISGSTSGEYEDDIAFREANDGESTHLRNVILLQRDYTALYPRRVSSSNIIIVVRFQVLTEASMKHRIFGMYCHVLN